MLRFQHILFPIDFSERSYTVRPFVKSMADQFHSKLTLMHVVHVPTGWYGGPDCGYPMAFDSPVLEEAARKEVNAMFGQAGNVETVIKVGDPASEITEFAERNHVDLIMMPTHGYGKFRSLLLGSVTAKVLHDAKCAVWTAAHSESPELTKHVACKSVMGAIDLGPSSVALIRRYAEIAREFNAKLRLVHAVRGAGAEVEHGFDTDFANFLIDCAREDLERLQAQAGTNLEVCMEGGAVSKIVQAAALHHDVDLILIGRGVLQERLGRLRTNAYSIIRDAPCPVLSVSSEAAPEPELADSGISCQRDDSGQTERSVHESRV